MYISVGPLIRTRHLQLFENSCMATLDALFKVNIFFLIIWFRSEGMFMRFVRLHIQATPRLYLQLCKCNEKEKYIAPGDEQK